MKYKKRILRLQARQKFYESLPKDVQNGYKRPGSLNK